MRKKYFSNRITKALYQTVTVLCLTLWPTFAHAELRICNTTSSRIGIALGYRDAQGWMTEGWWNLSPKGCETLLKGTLAARFYYVYGVDYDKGGEWGGKSFMCTRDREFAIRGTDNCFARGYDRVGFFEVQLTEPRLDQPQQLPPFSSTVPRIQP
jgi:uncharacterized membrane protein